MMGVEAPLGFRGSKPLPLLKCFSNNSVGCKDQGFFLSYDIGVLVIFRVPRLRMLGGCLSVLSEYFSRSGSISR